MYEGNPLKLTRVFGKGKKVLKLERSGQYFKVFDRAASKEKSHIGLMS